MSKTHLALFSGSFDPFTNAHLNIVERASTIFDKLYVGVGINPNKKTLLTVEERTSLIQSVCSKLNNVEVISYSGLTVDWAQAHSVTTLIRGIRTIKDYEFERDLYLMNKHLVPSIDTVFIPSSENLSFISSSFIKELLLSGGSIRGLVPDTIAQILEKKQISNI